MIKKSKISKSLFSGLFVLIARTVCQTKNNSWNQFTHWWIIIENVEYTKFLWNSIISKLQPTAWKSTIKLDHEFYGKINIFSVKSTFLLKKLLKSSFPFFFFLTTRSFCLGVIVLTLLIIIIVVILPFLSFWNPKKLESSKIFGILQNYVRTYSLMSFCIISYHFASFHIILYHFRPFIISIKCGNYPNYL